MAGRELPPTSPYAGDQGSCPPRLALALAEPDDGARLRAVVGALATSRVLVPVIAHLDERATAEEGDHGVAGEKVASAATVTVRAPDGRAAVPVFSGVGTMSRWDPRARPVPVPGRQAALAAAAEADGLVVLDPAGPAPVLIPRPAVWALAQGREWLPAPVDPEVTSAVERTVGLVAGVAEVSVEPGARAELRVVLAVRPGLDREGLAAVADAVSAALATSDLLVERVDSLELAFVPVAG